MKYGTQEVTGHECPQDCDDDVEQQVRPVMHQIGCYPTDYCSYDQVDNDVHTFLLIVFSPVILKFLLPSFTITMQFIGDNQHWDDSYVSPTSWVM